MGKAPFLITATIDRKRRYFCIFAASPSEAIRIFNEKHPNTGFKNLKRLEVLE